MTSRRWFVVLDVSGAESALAHTIHVSDEKPSMYGTGISRPPKA